jgi:hypothetical protein
MLEIITESLPRLELYKKLQSDKSLQIALLNIFTDIVEFCAVTYKYFKRGMLGTFHMISERDVAEPLNQNMSSAHRKVDPNTSQDGIRKDV